MQLRETIATTGTDIAGLNHFSFLRVEFFLDEALNELMADKFGVNKLKSLAHKCHNIVDGLVINGAEHDSDYVLEALKRIAKVVQMKLTLVLRKILNMELPI